MGLRKEPYRYFIFTDPITTDVVRFHNSPECKLAAALMGWPIFEKGDSYEVTFDRGQINALQEQKELRQCAACQLSLAAKLVEINNE